MYPHTSLAYFNGSHEYGDVIFGKYLSEKYPAVNVMKEIWEILADVSGDNAAAALNTFLGNRSPATTLSDAFSEFSAKNAVMDYDEGANYGGYGVDDKIRYQEEITAYPVARQMAVKSYSNNLPDYLGANYLKFTNSGTAQQIQFSFNGETSFNGKAIVWSAAVVAVKAAGGYDVSELAINASGDGTLSVTGFGSGGTYDQIYFVCRVLSETGVTPAESSSTPYSSYPAGVSYSIAAVLGGVSVSPMSTRLDIGETVQFTATGGVAPYAWDTSDHGVGTIDAAGLFTAVQYGTCTVSVTDSQNEGGFSGTITVSASTTSGKPPEPRDLPVRCFIATAAYGSPLAKEVGVLCRFRDRYLLTNQPGRWFVRNYYRFSPPLAGFISHHPVFKTATRIMLLPLIVFARFLLYPGWLFKTLFAVSLPALVSGLWSLKTRVN